MALNQSELQTPSKRLVRGISFQQKLAILRQLEAGIPRKDICENLQCCQSTISRVLVTKRAILEVARQDNYFNRKPVGMVTYKDIDAALSKWAQEMKKNKQVITSSLAKQKAEEIARAMGEEDFMPSAGWLYKWKERENVQFCKKSKVENRLLDFTDSEVILKSLLERHTKTAEECTRNSNGLKTQNDSNKANRDNSDTDHEGNLKDAIPERLHIVNNMRTQKNTPQNNTNDGIPNHHMQQLPEKIRIQSHFNSLENSPQKDTFPQTQSSTGKSDCNSSDKTSANSTPVSSQVFASSTARAKPKKVLYSYDPVYVLTSTGRYRKEKTFLTLLQKLEVLQRLRNGEKRSDLIHEYRLSQSAMCQIIADEKKITRMAAKGQNLHVKRVRGGIFKAGESELNTWVLEKMDNGETLTRNQVKNKAKEIADRMKLEFKASTGWLEKWKARMNMDFNEKHILYRKKPQYISNLDVEDTLSFHQMQHRSSEDGEDEDDEHMQLRQQQNNLQTQLDDDADDYHMHYNGDNSIDIKPFADDHEQFYPEVVTILEDEDEERDVKPFIKSPPHILPDEDSISSCEEDQQTLHQQVISWLNNYNIAPTAATELLTILHPVISENPDAPHQTRLTITTKPASRSKGRPYAQHTYS